MASVESKSEFGASSKKESRTGAGLWIKEHDFLRCQVVPTIGVPRVFNGVAVKDKLGWRFQWTAGSDKNAKLEVMQNLRKEHALINESKHRDQDLLFDKIAEEVFCGFIRSDS